MRDFVSCFSENAVNVSHPSCSSYSNAASVVSQPAASVQNAVTSLYATSLSAHSQQLILSVTWSRTHSAQGLTITFGEDPSAIAFKLDTSARFFRKKKGSKSYDLDNSKIDVFWDLSNAKYEVGPEPTSGFYLLLMVDSEIALVLGEMADEVLTKRQLFKTAMANPPPKSSLISRREHCSGNTLYSTKAKFCENGVTHEILIRCSGEDEGAKQPAFSVCIDKKTVIRVKRLQWNFRGNQTIFVDGLLVDLLWDVHDWFFSSAINGFAVFMFRRRSGLESRLWLEEKLPEKEKAKEQQKNVDFSLLIYASKSS